MSEKSRFSYLEVDDGPSRAELEVREAHAAAERARAHAEREATAEAEAARRARVQSERAAEENRLAEAIERHNAAASSRVALRKAKTAAARSRKSAKANANEALHKLNYNHYWKNRSEGMEAMKKAAIDAGYELTGEIWNEHHSSGGMSSATSDEGRLSYALQSPDGDGEPIGLHIQWYRMGSGKWELNAYVN